MSSDSITVHRLRVQAARPAAAQGVGDRLAEALRIASRPPALANRFVLIRRLRLSVPPGAGAQTIALLIEREWQRVLGAAVFIEEAGASAEVVWAPGEGAARLALLVRWLNDEDDSAWFWKRLVSASPSMPLVERIAALLIEPLAEAVAPLAVAMAWQREAVAILLRHRQLPAVLAMLPQAQRLPLQGLAEALQRGSEEAMPARELRPVDEARPGPTNVAGEPVQPLAAVARPLIAPTKPVEGIAEAVSKMALRATEPVGDGAVPAVAAVSARAAPKGTSADEAVPPCLPRVQPLLEVPPFPVVAGNRAQSLALQGQATAWAGLWLLVPVLLRQGFAAEPLAAGDPQSRHQAEVFVALLRRLQQRFSLDAVVGDWIDAQRSVDSEAARIEADAWWLKTRHASVRDARLPLQRLLRRPGELLLSDHRIDIVMPLRTLDIQLRRAGFDIDPGYLPWLDVVLRFHYA